ncbi:MAG: lipopolysaccharide transport periplasmic protein LptA [Burkholderiales bacterium]|nr:lipopolysaccharide transport periplasmic protein LptA [Burkholderiales bacterium]
MTPNAPKNAASRIAALLAACLILAAPVAFAEKADRDKPINIEADRVNVDDAKQIATFEGRVVLTQGTLIIRGDRMEVRQDQQGFKTGVAWGNLAYFRQKREGYDELIEGWAERIEYDSRADKVQMFNRASMKRGADEVRGNYISYDATTEFFQVTTSGAAAGSDNNRVRAVIQPKPKVKPAAQAPVTLQPVDGIAAPREALPAGR